MIHFHPLQVKQVEKETDDTVVVEFDVPAHLEEQFRFVQGQNLTIRKDIGGEELRRNYSICSAPHENRLRIAVKKVAGGRFSSWANEDLRAGDVLEVLPPTGKFHTPLHPSQSKHYVAFVAGSGITPVISIIKTTLQTEPGSRLTLVYGNRSKGSIIFKEDLEAIKDKYLQRFSLYHVLSREQSDAPFHSGRIDSSKLDIFFNRMVSLESCDEFFLCGPEAMIFTVKDYLAASGVPPEKIHFELFTVPGQTGPAQVTETGASAAAAEQASITVKLDGIAFDFPLAKGGKSILDAALAEGADLPYACKGGVCTTCKALLKEGEVRMDVNWGLEPDEVAKGFILTCQSHPVTSRVVVDFDAR